MKRLTSILLISFIVFSIKCAEVAQNQEHEIEYKIWIPRALMYFKLKPTDPVSRLFEKIADQFLVKVEEITLYDDSRFKSNIPIDRKSRKKLSCWSKLGCHSLCSKRKNDIVHTFQRGLKYSEAHNIKMENLIPLKKEYCPYFPVLIIKKNKQLSLFECRGLIYEASESDWE